VRFASAGESAAETAELAASIRAEWVVVDGYQFGSDYMEKLQQAGLRVLFIDDYGHADRHPADLVLNQNPHASESLYPNRGPSTGLLLGPRYALLRREFLAAPRESEQPAVARKILITLGGSDPENVTAKAIRALAQLDIPDLEAVVVVGPANPHHAALRKLAGGQPYAARVERDPANLPELFAWADIAVSAAGSTCWELAYMGLPAIAVVCAENQMAVAESLHQAGSVESLGDHSMLSSRDIAAAVKCLCARNACGNRCHSMGARSSMAVAPNGLSSA
jgi:UDP-2,4-diacetamido-2,4,6-trideoxy-beta-L-altropyranose hydrolase